MALSPMMQYYFSLKEKYKDSILFFRLGDFYEMFFDDAKTASELLDLTLTGRDCGLETRAPMCGVPYHAVDGYISKLVSKGIKVAICEQLSEPNGKTLVERDVVRVITPGTIIEDNILDDKKSNYLACLTTSADKYAVSWLDISTGEFNTTCGECKDFCDIEDILVTFSPSEIICDQQTYDFSKSISQMRLDKFPKFQLYYDWAFDFQNAQKLLLAQFKLQSLASMELDDKKSCVVASGALLNYVNETQKRALNHISSIKFQQTNKFLILDSNTRRNLELCANAKDGSKKASLLWALDKTKTNMGARNLRRWIEQPLRDEKAINDRLDSVEELIAQPKIRANVAELLPNVKDIERLTSKIAYGNPTPRELVTLKNSLAQLPTIKAFLQNCKASLLQKICKNIFPLEDVCELLDNSIDENPPALTKDGGYIKNGYNKLLDEYRGAKESGNKWLLELENKEKELTQIRTLKIGYNRVFGYYIEVSNGMLEKVPFRYIRKQTLTTGERFITEELKEIEEKLLGATEKAITLESEIFNKIKDVLAQNIQHLQSTSRAIAMVDTLLSFANVAIANNYHKPQIDASIENINIKNGRHPVVEALSKDNSFVPNDTLLDCYDNRTMIITGPNMAGKSTYMRQVALITLMAHIGCFVPADQAQISLTDRIFTRIGASDDLAYGQSTFMVEMVEVATILRNATFKSLLILDEIGRGTSTFDGLAIAKAVMEDVSTRIRCKTLFSTHYHELSELEGLLNGVKNYKIIATEKNNEIIFLHKIMRGGTNKSFGIEVAKLAGVPQTVIARAKEISKLLTKSKISTVVEQEEMPLFVGENDKKNKILQDIAEDLKELDINELSPIQAFAKLSEMKEKIKE